MGKKPMTTAGGQVTRNGVLAWLGCSWCLQPWGSPRVILSGLASAHQWTCVCRSVHQLKTFLSSTSRKVLCWRKLKTWCTKVQCWRKETTCCVSQKGTFSASPSATFSASLRGICFDCQSEQKRTRTEICV